MNRQSILTRTVGRVGLAHLSCLAALGATAHAQSRTYTTDADFDLGVLVQVNHDAPNNDQLQLDEAEPFSVLSVACGGLDTMVRINTTTGEILGEYRTVPGTLDGDPSRATSVDNGDVWVGNRLEDGQRGMDFGSVSKFGLIYGGTRVNADGSPNPLGGYLQGPFECNTCVDRDGDGLIRTSRGLGDVLGWPNVTDGLGGPNGLVEDATDECALIFQRTNPIRIRHLALDSNDNLWAGGYPTFPTSFDEIDGATGAILSNTPAIPPGCGGYAGIFDSNGVMWSTSELEGQLFRLDVAGGTAATCINVQNNVRGVDVAPDGFIWTAGGTQLARVSPDGSTVQLFSVAGSSQLHGILVDQASGELWVASSGSGQVFRLDNAANLIATISAGSQPRSLAMDNNGKVWVVNQGSDDAMRIDPATNAIDLTVALRPGSLAYNPSDMIGSKVIDGSSLAGTWSVVSDGGLVGTNWTNVAWNDSVPAGAQLRVFVRSANSAGALATQLFVETGNGAGIAEIGRFLEVQAIFERLDPAQASPILFDLSVEGENLGEPEDCIMGQRRQAGSLLVFPEFDNVTGSASVLTVSNVDPAGETLAVEFVYIDGDTCAEFNRTELLTPNDTLTLLTSHHNPQQERGYVYVFVKDPQSGEPIVSNSLIGEMFIMNGGYGCEECEAYAGGSANGNLGPIEYSLNAVSFKGVGNTGDLTDVNLNGLRDLDDVEYEMAPDAILIPRFFGQSAPDPSGQYFYSDLILVSLTGGARFDTTVDFLVYNDNEEGFSAEHTFYCWDKVPLLAISDVFRNEFLANSTNDDPNEVLGATFIESGWMRMDGAVANSLSTSIPDPAFLAVLVERLGHRAAADLAFEECGQLGGVLLPRSQSGD